MGWTPAAETGHTGDLWDSLPASAQLLWPCSFSVEPNDFCGYSMLLPGLCAWISLIPAQGGSIDARQRWQADARAASFPQTPKEEYGTRGTSSQGSQGSCCEGGRRMQPPQAGQWYSALPSLPVLTLPNNAPALPIPSEHPSCPVRGHHGCCAGSEPWPFWGVRHCIN